MVLLRDGSSLAWLCRGIMAALLPARKILSRLLPFEAQSPVQALALLLGGYLVGNTALALTQDVLAELADTSFSVTVVDVFSQQVGFIVSRLLWCRIIN